MCGHVHGLIDLRAAGAALAPRKATIGWPQNVIFCAIAWDELSADQTARWQIDGIRIVICDIHHVLLNLGSGLS
jgi:hypothetical protein